MNCKDDCKNYEGCEYAPECECVMCCINYEPNYGGIESEA